MSTTVLRIDSSVRKEGSISRDLTDRIVAKLAPETVLTRDLTEELPLIDGNWVGANFTPADQRTDEQKATLALSDSMIEELKSADTVVIGVPIYNFGVPARLKAWVDLVARAGVTFRYTETGPIGLLEGKRAIIATASGGVPVGSATDFATTYLKQVLAFIGITDVTIIAADQLAIDPEGSVKKAQDAVEQIAA
ncbi:FMN-dependent NADH-azoreductase [Donghicola sp. C2-DW-16]|uniref:FMN dependent NADH:quinone oxidoreductase n=1 Tax=Donghicola mangrovi TaxID=2729614 RepID=A0ABX2PGU2_9RHOB|nr:NAD(P)H-dependent oxidoreductase [Donghicola mangrovi]NVO28705.1 FMN-dependent NADH-azoreductase [Donghicola mangrovi]